MGENKKMFVVTPTPEQLDMELKIRAKFMRDVNKVKGKRIPFKDMVRANGLKIKKLIKDAGLKPSDVAQKIGVDVNQIQRIIRYQRFDPKYLEAIAEVLEVEKDSLIYEGSV